MKLLTLVFKDEVDRKVDVGVGVKVLMLVG